MAAVFTGTGLGMFNSSLTQLGGSSGGAGGVGQSGERQYVNLATGNLVLQDIDESILTRGLPIGFVRTYNSRGQVTESGRQVQVGQDGWLNVFERNVSGLTGTVNTAGSTVKRTLGDGSEVVFAWDASRSAYVSTVGEGAHDTITWNASNSRWTWTEGTTRDQEVYDASGTNGGRLLTILNAKSGAQYNVTYTATGPSGLVSTVYSSLTTGDGLSFTYTSGRLTRVSTREGGTIVGQVDYAYDNLNRLISVTTDLTPQITTDNAWSGTASSNDGKLFRTTYAYESLTDANNLRIASVTYSDGTLVSYGYDGSGRVIRATVGDSNGNDADGLGQTTTYAYGTTSGGGLTPVTVTDASGRAWVYRFDAATNALKQIDSPAVGGVVDVTAYAYDASGNLTQITTTRGATTLAQVTYTHDGHGNALSEVDLLGNRIDRTWSTTDQLLTETRYTTPNPNTAPTNLQPTTRFAYDASNRLRFVINAQGEVTEYLYGTSGSATGLATTMRRFTGALYDVATTNNNVAPAVSTMTSWTSGKLAATERTDYLYDAMGRLQETRAYAQVAQTVGTGVAIGDGVLDAATDITRFTYDAQGLLRQQITQRGAGRTLGGTAANESEVVDYTYDGMGRLLTVLTRGYGTAAMPDARIDAAGHAAWVAANDATTVLTTYVYTDSGNTLKVMSDTGMTRTEVRNAYGQVIAVTEANAPSSPSVTRTTQFHYDMAGRLIADEDASGGRRFYLYDEKGRLKATIDATGAVMETVYDGMDRMVETRRYANRVTPQANWWAAAPPTGLWRSDAGIPPEGALVVTADATRDQVTQSTYDGAGRLATTTVLGADDAQTLRTTYGYDGAGRLIQTTVSDGAGTAATARTTRYLYDKAGRPVATVDALGYVTETVYDLAGRVAKTIRYANVSANPAATDVAALRPAALDPARDQTTRYFYDGRGQQVGVLDAEGHLTEYVYDEALNQRAVKAYAKRLTGLTGSESFSALKTAATTAAPAEAFRLTQRSFNALGQVTVEANPEGTLTQYTYDDAGRLVKTSTGNVGEQIRDGHLRYDVFGNLTGELTGEGAALLLPTMTPTQIDALYVQYGVRHSYDLVGRRTESIDAAGNKTWYFHDANGRQTFVVRGVHDSANLQNARGEVTETRYDAFGQVLDSIAYTGAITIPVPGDRESVKATLATLAFASATDSRTQLAYDRRGLLTQRIDAEGYRTTYAYNAFGEQTVRQDWELIDGTPGNSVRLTTDTVYDKRGQATSTTQTGGTLTRTTSASYDAFGRALTLTDARGVVRTLSYDRLGRQVGQSIDLGGGRIEAVATTYDAYSRVTTQTDALGRATSYAYSDTDRTMTVITPEGVAITTEHDRFGQTVEVRQPLPDGTTATTRTAYDRNGDVVSVTDALGKVSTNVYDARGLLSSSTDASGRAIAYEYDAVGRVLKRREDPNGLNLTTTYAYDGQGRQVRVTDASGRTTTMAYDRRGQLTETVRDPQVNGVGLALKTTYTWDRDGRQLTVTEGAGTANATTVAYGYDALGRRTTETSAPGTLNLTTTYAYDANDNVTTKTDASGRVTRYAYDAANRLRYVVDGMGRVTESVYDLAGRTTLVRTYAKPANLTGLSLAPTEAELSTLVTNQALANDALDETTYRLYDRDGRVRLSIDGSGGVSESVYDTAGRTIRTTRYAQAVALTPTLRTALRDGTATVAGVGVNASAADESVRHVYDAAGQLRYSIDATGGYRGVWYDAAGRVAVMRAMTQRLNMSNIADGMTVAQIDAMNLWGATDDLDLFVYDGAGRLRYELQTVGDPTAFPFAAAVTERTYDGANRTLSTRRFASSMTLESALIAKLGAGTAEVSDFAAFVAANAGNAQSERSVYDAAGRRQYSIDGTGGYIRYRYDAAGRVVVVRHAATRIDPASVTDATTAAQLEALVPASATDALDLYVYDAASRLRYTVKAIGSSLVRPFDAQLTETTWDGAGRMLSTRSFPTMYVVDETTVQKLAAGTATDADFASFVAANAGTAQSQRHVYDAAGREVYTIDAIGAFSRTWYDAMGRATAVRRFATPVNPATLGDATTVAALDAQLTWTAADPTEYRAYDATGRVRITYNSLGLVTQTDYDGAGRATVSRGHSVAYFPGATLTDKFFAGTATVADFATFAAANESTARVQSTVYDAAGRARYTLARNVGTWTVGERQYDGVGRVSADVRYGVTIAHVPSDGESQVIAALNGALSSDPAVRATQTRTTRYLYDAANRQRFLLDATLAVSEQRYDAIGRVLETRSYGNLLANGTSIDTASVATWTQGQSLTDVRRVANSYDTAGQLTARTDALGNAETFAYDGAGRMLTRTDRMGAVWTYQYDAAGRRTAEISPQAEIFSIDAAGNLSSSVRALTTRYAYDALGRLLAKTENADTGNTLTTDYVYDTRGNLIRTVFADPGQIDPATGDIVFTGVRPTREVVYDALGRAVVEKDERGHHRYVVHDALGRVAYEIDQESYVTAYGYDAYGEQTALTRYAAKLQTGASAFVSANWQAGQAISLAQMQATGSLLPNAAADRTIATSHDALGRKIRVVQSTVNYLRSNGTLASGAPTTTFAYSAYGDLTTESVLLEGSEAQGDAVWAQTRRYHDAVGRNILTVDAEGYVTTMTYNATGDLTKTVEHARAVATAGLNAQTAPSLPAAGDAAIGFDRETRFTYDALGRKATQTIVRNYQRSDGSTGRLDAVTSYGYDNEDRATTVADATGTITTTYNALGQSVAVQEQARSVLVASADAQLQTSATTDLESAALYEQRSPYSAMMYNAFGWLIGVRRYANGRVGSDPVVADAARDQLAVTRYLKSGKPGMSLDALGNAVYSQYDAAGNLIKRWSRLDGSEDVRDAMAHDDYSYDKAGRQLSAQQRRMSLDGVNLLSLDQYEVVQYNAFGEIVSKAYEGVLGTLLYTYDAAGRMIADNSAGAVREFGYNLAGHQVRESHKVKRDATSAAIDAVTRIQADKLGRAVATILPSHTDDAGVTSVVRQKYDRWGNRLQVIDGRGYQTDYQYNDHNQLVRETRPLVWVVGENGGGSWQRPVNQWYYGAYGRLLATRDANGNLRTMAYDAVGHHIKTVDSFGNETHHAYDVLGQQRLTQDALGYIAWKDYDRNGRVVAIGDFLAGGAARTRNVQQSYVLNQAGDRVQVANALSQSVRYDYDSLQRTLRSETAAGVVMQYRYDVQGRKILETNGLVNTGGQAGPTYTDREQQVVNLNELSWKYDAFGRLTDHNNLSGRDSDYVYDASSGVLTSESASGGSNSGYADAVKEVRYYPNGRIQQITETGGKVYRYEYDAAGNRTLEETTTVDGDNKAIHTITRTTYDSNNRVQRVVQDDVLANKRVFDLRYDYDANGNRRRVLTQSGYGDNVEGIVVVNAAPAVVSPPADRGVRKGQTSEFRLLFSDVFRDAEGDALTLTIAQGDGSALPAWLTASRDAQTGEIVFVAAPAANAADTDVVVRLTAYETATPANSVTATFLVKVRANNASEAVGGAVTFNAKLNESFGRDLVAGDHFRDIDVGDALALSVVGTLPAWLSVNTSAPGLVRLSGVPTTAGSASFTLRATDANGATVDKTITIAAAANLPPTLVAAPAAQDATINRSFAWTMPLSQLFADGNGDALQVTASGLPSWLSFQHIGTQSPPQLRISGQVPPDAVDGQSHNVVLTATDTSGASVSATLQVRVTNNIPPQPPQVANKTAKQNLAYSVVLPEFFDENGDALTYGVVNLPPGLSFNASTRTIGGTPTTAGGWVVAYSGSDGRVLTTTYFTLFVEANNAPVAPTVGTQNGTRNTPVYLVLPAFADPNGDALTHGVSNLPPGLSFNASTRTITGTPTTSGSWTVSYTANDGRGGVTGTTFVFAIAEPVGNQPPVVTNPLADQLLMGGAGFSFAFPANTFADPEGQTLIYTKAVIAGPNAASWLNFNAATRTFSGTAPALLAGPWTVRVTATDPSGASVYDDFELAVDTGEGMMAGGGETYSFEMGLSEETLTQGAAQSSSASSGPTPVQVKDEWYLYDSENRIKLSGGALSGAAGAQGTTIQLSPLSQNSDAWERGYDAVGRLVLTYRRVYNPATQSEATIAERTSYDARGQRLYAFHQQIIGGGYSPDPGISTRYSYDAAGRVTEVRSYYANGTTMPTPVTIEGEVQTRDVSGWLSGAQRISYDNDGRVRWQETLGRDETVPYYLSPETLAQQYGDLSVLELRSREEYTLADATPSNFDDNATAYDAAGRLTSYRYTAQAADESWYTHTFSSVYEGWEGYQEKTVSGTSSNTAYKPTTNTLTYDDYGRLLKQQEHTEYQDDLIDDRVRVYANTAEGQVQTRREGTRKQVNGVYQFVENDADSLGQKTNYGFVYSGGQQVAELKSGGKTRSGQALGSIVGVNGAGAYAAGGGTVTVLAGETLRDLAQRVYGTNTLWYVLADANGLSDAETALTAGHQLKAPGVNVNRNDAGTFRPYNPNDAIGSTAPSLPYIPPTKCDVFLMVMIAVIVIAVTIATWGAATGQTAAAGSAAAGAAGGAGGAAAGGTAAAGGAAAGGAAGSAAIGSATVSAVSAGGAAVGSAAATGVAAASTSLSFWTGVMAGAAAGAAGAATQGALSSFVGIGSFSWRNVVAGGITGAITGGVGAVNVGSVVGQMGQLLLAGSASYIGNKVAGVPNTHFSWRDVAANAVASAVSSGVGDASSSWIGNDATRGLIGGAVGGATSAGIRKLLGADDEFDYMAVIQGAINGMMSVKPSGGMEDEQTAAPVVEPSSDLSAYGAYRDVWGRLIGPDGLPIGGDVAAMGGMSSAYSVDQTLESSYITTGRFTGSLRESGSGFTRMPAGATGTSRPVVSSTDFLRKGFSMLKRLIHMQQLEAESMALLEPGQVLIEGISVSAKKDQVSGTTRDLLRGIRNRAPQLASAANFYDWVGRSNLHAVKYDRMRIPLTATYQEAKQIYAYNAAMTRREHAEYIWRTYEGHTNNTRYDVPRYDAGAQQWADLKALVNVPVGVAEGLANGVVTLAQELSPIHHMQAAIRGRYETWQPFEADNAGQQLGHFLSVPVGMVIAPESILLRAGTTAPRAYTGLRAVKTWEDVGVPAASNGARSAIAESLSGSGRVATQAVEGRVAANSGRATETIASASSGRLAELLPESSLTKRQAAIHQTLSEPGSFATFPKRQVSMSDLRQIGKVTGDEYNMFTKNGQRLIIRGQGNEVAVSAEMYDDLLSGVYGRWSGHTHPPGYSLNPGPADRPFLTNMNQRASAIWGDDGFYLFGRNGLVDDTMLQSEAARKVWVRRYGQQ